MGVRILMHSLFRSVVEAGFVAIVLAALVGAAPVHAGGARIDTGHIVADIVPRDHIVAPGDTLEIAIVQEIADGWHTYWVNPGDSGEPMRLDWRLPAGASPHEIRWPTPQRVAYPPLMNYGYTGTAIALTAVDVPADWPAGRPFPVDLAIDWLVCEQVCIPESGRAAFEVATGPETRLDSTQAFTFVRAGQGLPKEPGWQARWSRGPDGLVLQVTADGLDPAAVEDAYFFPREGGVIDHTAPQPFLWEGNEIALRLQSAATAIEGDIDGILKIRLANGTQTGYLVSAVGQDARAPLAVAGAPHSTSGNGAATLTGADAAPTDGSPSSLVSTIAPTISVAPAPPAAGNAPLADRAGPPGLGVLGAVLFALLGGLILNMMPCVFPVLALKTMAFLRHAEYGPATRAMHGFAYAGGVLVSFAALAGALIVLRHTGSVAGWGFQLQNPLVVAILAYVMVLVGLNLSGLFEVGTSLAGTGAGLTHRGGASGSFFTGVLASVVATPCTAPFMAAAIGFALTATPAVTMAVFLALGLGLALPFLLLGIAPGLAARLPKPGAWMVRLRQLLAFPMYAAAAWLVWVLAQQVGVDAVFAVLIGFVLIAFTVWLVGLVQHRQTRFPRPALAAASAAGLLALGLLVPVATGPGPVAAIAEATTIPAGAVPFTRARLDSLRAEGRPVLLNVTAAWCITCKVNENVVFTTDAFRAALAESGATYMVADWTRRDPEISALLEEFGRAGVPLYVVWPRNGGPPEVLPQILTNGIVLDALSRA